MQDLRARAPNSQKSTVDKLLYAVNGFVDGASIKQHYLFSVKGYLWASVPSEVEFHCCLRPMKLLVTFSRLTAWFQLFWGEKWKPGGIIPVYHE